MIYVGTIIVYSGARRAIRSAQEKPSARLVSLLATMSPKACFTLTGGVAMGQQTEKKRSLSQKRGFPVQQGQVLAVEDGRSEVACLVHAVLVAARGKGIVNQPKAMPGEPPGRLYALVAVQPFVEKTIFKIVSGDVLRASGGQRLCRR